MFTCKDSVSLLMSFLDGELTDELERQLHEHLEACPPCVDFLYTYRATPELCRKALTSKMPTELSDKLTEFLRLKCRK